MFGFFSRKNDDKIIEDALEIVGTAFVLQGYGAEDAMSVAKHALNQVVEDDSRNLPKPWVLSVFGLWRLKKRIEEVENQEMTAMLPDIKEIILLSIPNAINQATPSQKDILRNINKVVSDTHTSKPLDATKVEIPIREDQARQGKRSSCESNNVNELRRGLAESLLKEQLEPLVGSEDALKFANYSVGRTVADIQQGVPHEQVIIVLAIDHLLELLVKSDDERLIDLVPEMVKLMQANMHAAEANAETDDLPKLRDLGKRQLVLISPKIKRPVNKSDKDANLTSTGLQQQVERLAMDCSEFEKSSVEAVEQDVSPLQESESQSHQTSKDEIPVATIGDDSQCEDAIADEPLMVFTPSTALAPRVIQKLQLADAKDILSDFEEFHDDLGSGFYYDESLLPWPKELIMRSIYTILREPALREEDEYVAAAYLVYEIVKYQPDIGDEPYDNSSYDTAILKAILDSNRTEEEKKLALERHVNNRHPNVRKDLDDASATELAMLTYGLKEFEDDDEGDPC